MRSARRSCSRLRQGAVEGGCGRRLWKAAVKGAAVEGSGCGRERLWAVEGSGCGRWLSKGAVEGRRLWKRAAEGSCGKGPKVLLECHVTLTGFGARSMCSRTAAVRGTLAPEIASNLLICKSSTATPPTSTTTLPLRRPCSLACDEARTCTHGRLCTKPPEAFRGHQKPSEAIRGYQRPSEAIRGHQKPSEAIRGHQRPSEGRHLRANLDVGHLDDAAALLQLHTQEAVVISGNQW